MDTKNSLETNFNATFTAVLAKREKQIQQNYRPIIGVHKWFARRPGTVFRNLLLSEFNGEEPLETSYWRAHNMKGVIADPFMGGGIPIYEANRLGFSVIGTDINPMAYWIVRQSLVPLDICKFSETAQSITEEIEEEIGNLYSTTCTICNKPATVKYFIWVKVSKCPSCGAQNDLFPGYLLSQNARHPNHVVACARCGQLNEFDRKPEPSDRLLCNDCGHPIFIQGNVNRTKCECRNCSEKFSYMSSLAQATPEHRLWAIEYHCSHCKPTHKGRFFKKPDYTDLDRLDQAKVTFDAIESTLPIPDDEIPEGDETSRLKRWGYKRFRDMFSTRQLLGLGLLLKRIRRVKDQEIRYALLTVFSDFLRYQNMLCRYDTWALKCQDIFSVHGFPVGLIQCENNILGIPKVGSGAFRHFVEKYIRAKKYCMNPFETRFNGKKKEIVHISGERIDVKLVKSIPRAKQRRAHIRSASATEVPLPPNTLDGVFTDPPYYANVQYAELMDFCFCWLRLALKEEFEPFRATTTRTQDELTGNITMGRGLDHFTDGLSKVFCHYAAALKPNAPFVFTYHHNDPAAYVPIVVSILDAGLLCTATLPAPAEMGASLHIARSNSSVLDSIFICRKAPGYLESFKIGLPSTRDLIYKDINALTAADMKLTEGDVRCLLAGHIARVAIIRLQSSWNKELSLGERISIAQKAINQINTDLTLSSITTDNRNQIRPVRENGYKHVATI